MERQVTRAKALAAFGSVTLTALLAACSGRSGDAITTTAEVETETGGTTTVEPATAATTADDGSAAALLDDSSACTLTVQQTEGPYYFDADAIRSDIREDREGATLRLAVRVRDAGSCAPLANAVVEIWHCDAAGLYSGFEAASRGEGGGGRTDDERYLRGAQVTNAEGLVEFLTIYPGWYRGRTVHVHATVHVDNARVVTTQFFFDEDVTAEVFAREPYASARGRDVFNDTDGFFDPTLLLRQGTHGSDRLGAISVDVQTA